MLTKPTPARRGRPSRPPRPDHFIGIRIHGGQALAEIRREILKRTPDIAGFMEEEVKAHVTLGVLRLDTPEKLARCTNEFKRSANTVREVGLFPSEGFRIAFRTFDMFDQRVLFLRPSDPCIAKLKELRSYLFDTAMSEFNADTRQDYKPHLTLAKRTRWVSKRREMPASGLPKVPPTMPEDTTAYGDVVVDVDAVVASVELVQMRGEKEADGYYKIVASEPLCGQVREDRQSDDAWMTG